MGWWNTGFESQDNAWDFNDGKAGGPRRFWMPPEVEKRVLCLDDNPQTYWEHNFKYKGSWMNWEPCKIRNRIEDDCELCDRYPDRYPAFLGLLSCINMTPWENKKGQEFCYARELIAAKMGGKDKPGMLKKLERLKKQHGGLTGAIFDIYRSGAKTESIGDEWTLVEKIPPKEIASFGKKMLKEWVEKVNENIEDPEKHLTVEKLWDRYPWEPFDYEEVIKMRSNEELRVMLGSSTTDDDNDDGGSSAADQDAPY